MRVLLVNVAMLIVVGPTMGYGGTPTAEAIREPVTQKEVIFASVVYRHGDRTIIDPYPNDPWRNPEHWPEEFGQLTNTGIEQHFAAGKFLRQHYSSLISEKYDPEEVSVRSTDVDRTLMSAQASLAGMYPPVGKSVWNKNLNWRPIPVHTVPADQDPILAMGKRCSAYNDEMSKFLQSEKYLNNLKTQKTLMLYLTQNSGRVIKSFSDIEYLYNTLWIESIYNFTLPAWTANIFPDKMIEPSLYSFTIPTATRKLAKFKVGPFLKEVTEAMQTAIEAKKTGKMYKKLAIYSAHDDTIANILNALNMFKPHFPSYTATIFFELIHDNATMLDSIQILYKSSSQPENPVALNIPKCGYICPLTNFLQLYNKTIPNDWDIECEQEWNVIVPIAVVLVVVLLAAFTRWYRNFAANNMAYIAKNQREEENLDAITVDGINLAAADDDAVLAMDATDLDLKEVDLAIDAVVNEVDAADTDSIDTGISEATTIAADDVVDLSTVNNYSDPVFYADKIVAEFEELFTSVVPEVRLNGKLLDKESALSLIP